MPIESATNISQLVTTNPNGTDMLSTVDNHIRLLKTTLLNTFPGITGLATQAEAEAGTSSTKLMTPLRVQEAISKNFTTTTAGTYTKLTINNHGQVTGGTTLTSADLPQNPLLTGAIIITTNGVGGNANIEIGRTDGTATSPYIDFHSGATMVDFDARILASGGTGTIGGGTLTLTAATTAISGNATISGTTTINGATTINNTVGGTCLATTSEAQAGTVSNKLMTPQTTASVVSQLPFTKSFVSANQSINATWLLTLPHGLGEIPKLITYSLVCTASDAGYSVGDVVDINMINNTDSGNSIGNGVYYDATNIYIRYSHVTNMFIGANKTTGAAVHFVSANWKLIVRAFA